MAKPLKDVTKMKASFWKKLGDEVADRIQVHTKKGKDVNDANFDKYSTKYANAKRAGMAVGSITFQTIENSLIPSIRAALIRSSGTVLKNWRIKNIPNTEMVHGITREAKVLVKPSFASIK